MIIPVFPLFARLTLEMQPQIEEWLLPLTDGISEFTFAGLYLFRERYNYKVSIIPGKTLVVSGERDGKRFFSCPAAAPSPEELRVLFSNHDYWKNISESIVQKNGTLFEEAGLIIEEDRDNFDYLYLRTDLARLSGKNFHKKRNLVNAFYNTVMSHEERLLTREELEKAKTVIERWKDRKVGDADYGAAMEALLNFDQLRLSGMIFYVDNKPAGFCMGEPVAAGNMYLVHFEKAIDDYKGIYQFVNMTFAAFLPETVTYINREQDMGDGGLRQAKETYRPCGFIKKYRAILEK
jgi:hypothetical protein